MNDTKNQIGVVSLSNYVQPEVREYASREYVTYGKNNSYFQYLIDRSRGSATNGAVISSLVDLIYGGGVTASNKAQKPNEWAMLLSILRPDDVKRLVSDLYTLGQCAIQVQYAGGHKSIKSCTHLPIETLAIEKVDEDGEINGYFYAPDWSKVRSKKDLEYIPAFGTSKEGIEILYVKPYRSGLFYYSTVSYQGGLQYAELEEEIGNYHINNIQNGLAPSMVINFNNGLPKSEEEANEIIKKFEAKYKGSDGAGKMVFIFAKDKEHAATITPVPLSDASEQYQFLSTESAQKILTAHRVTSPLLLGLPSATGFGSNADEMETSLTLLEWWVAKPYRNLLIDSFNQILSFNNISLSLEFESLNPFKKEVDITELHTHDNELQDYLDTLTDDLDGYELVDEREVDYDLEQDFNEQVKEWNEQLSVNLVSSGTARPNAKSGQDKKIGDTYFKVRYKYTGNPNPERQFCKTMMRANKVYRKEDIDMMSEKPVNRGFGEHGAATYDIFKYKGGARCHHKWLRQTYMSTDKSIDVRNPFAKTISTGKAEKAGYRIRNPKEVAMMPNDMPRKGFSPNNPNLPADV